MGVRNDYELTDTGRCIMHLLIMGGVLLSGYTLYGAMSFFVWTIVMFWIALTGGWAFGMMKWRRVQIYPKHYGATYDYKMEGWMHLLIHALLLIFCAANFFYAASLGGKENEGIENEGIFFFAVGLCNLITFIFSFAFQYSNVFTGGRLDE